MQQVTNNEDRINQLLSKWNDDERDVSPHQFLCRNQSTTELKTHVSQKMYDKDYMYCPNRRPEINAKARVLHDNDDYNDDTYYKLSSYEKYTDRNLSWSDDDGDMLDITDEYEELDSAESSKLNSPIKQDESYDIVENMIYKKFCYY